LEDRLGELLVRRNVITSDQLRKALEEQKTRGGRLGSSLVRLGFIKEDELLSFLSAQYRVPSIRLSKYEINPNVIKLIPSSIAKKYFIIPVHRVGPKLTLAMADPSNIMVIDEIKFMTGFNVEPVVASETEIIDAIKKYYGGGGSVAGLGNVSFEATDYSIEDEKNSNGNGFALEEEDVVDVDDFDKLVHGAVDNVEVVEQKDSDGTMEEIEGPIIKIVNGILILKAIKTGASDIHFEPYERTLRVRFRVDGVMRREMNLPIQIKNAIVSRLKIMSKFDIAERRLPQDGRIKLRLAKGREMDFRVSTIPVLFGEKVVLRLLDKSALQLDMTKLGFEESSLEDFKAALKKPVGMILVTGPTGSGKTTTLYSALSELNKETRKHHDR
jgi:type IV pilus assembly protein PilB